MKLSLNQLSDYLDTSVIQSPKSYCDIMTDTGSKVEGFEMRGEEISNVVVGKILSIEKHPDADKLVVCSVDIGKNAPIQIVTAAKNMKENDLVPVALDGAHLAGGIDIKAGKLRGVLSQGMFCSIAELGLTVNDVPYAIEDGLLILEENCSPGDDIRDVLMMKDTVIEFEITPNRPDCLSVIGLARETAASYGIKADIKTPVVKGSGGNIKDYVSVKVLDDKLCQRYTARVVKNVKIAPSPMWMRSRLRMMGVRPINNIVDITNYVMLEYGQPMHAFDHNFIKGNEIIVRRAFNDEALTTLDGQERKLTEKMLLICDAEKPIALAGIMGGENSEINDNTTTVVFESANFDGTSVRLTSRALGMRTESSGRFEKGLDPENTLNAINRACELVEMLGAGEVVDGIIDIYNKKQNLVRIAFEPERINKFLGTDISADRMREILLSLNFVFDGNDIIPPSYRSDVLCFADIAEEIARIYGYNKIESTDFKCTASVGHYDSFTKFKNKLASILEAVGYQEILTYSFISPKTYDLLNLSENSEKRNSVVISNPLGEDTSVMRTTSVGSMIETLSHNYSFRNSGAKLYEMSRIYIPSKDTDKLPEEKNQLVIGNFNEGDFYDLKGVCELICNFALGKNYGAKKNYDISITQESYLHPGRSAKITKDNIELISFGEVHPGVLKNYSLPVRAYIASVDVDALYKSANFEKTYRELPKFPSVDRDLAFVVNADTTAGEIEELIIKYAGKKLEKVKLFDIYTGSQLPEGKKSLAFSLTIRDSEKTMTDEEADKITSKVIKGIERELGFTLR